MNIDPWKIDMMESAGFKLVSLKQMHRKLKLGNVLWIRGLKNRDHQGGIHGYPLVN